MLGMKDSRDGKDEERRKLRLKICDKHEKDQEEIQNFQRFLSVFTF